MKILLNFIFLLFLCSSFSQAEEKEKNFFCTEDFRFGNIYSLDLLKQKLAEGLDVNEKCSLNSRSIGLDYILMKIKKPLALKILEQAGADFDTRRKSHDGALGRTLLHIAAKGSLPHTISFLINKGYEINAKDELGNTPMSNACKFGNVEMIKTLINNGANYQYKSFNDKENKSCLIDASLQQNSFESIKYLFSIATPKDLPKCTHKNNISECSLFSKIYLDRIWYSSERYDSRVLKFFKENGEDLNEYFAKRSYLNTYTTILNELVGEKPEQAILNITGDLIKLGANVNKPQIYKYKDIDRIEETPIFNVFRLSHTINKIHHNNVETLVDLLVKSGANLNHLVDDSHFSLLLENVLGIREQKFRHKIIEKLISYGLNINSRDKYGENILFKTYYLDKNYETVEFLISLGADFNIRNESAETLLHEWSYANNPRLVKKFINLGLNVNSRDNLGRTPLISSVNHPHYLQDSPDKNMNKRLEVLKALMDAGSNINLKSKGDANMLHIAAYKKHPTKVLSFIKQRGVDINGKTSNGNTPIIASVIPDCHNYRTYKKCIKLKFENLKFFVESGANINHRNEDGLAALHFAAKYSKSSESVLYLLNKGADHKARTKEGKTALDLIKKNYLLKDGEARWKLHDLSFE